ncbi:MAG: endonuclease domain-containing protein [Candidatus Saccharibacteria bacterium]|nr:endonuclease domain-containing protein [Candidatus Saccharibacteria bacterium]
MMTKMYNTGNEKLARNLRKNMMLEERILWYQYLRTCGVRFLRQKPIDSYIVDFYCPKLKLAIELDGSQHYQDKGLDCDKERSVVLSKYGIKVIRIPNNEIKSNFKGVCEYLSTIIDSSNPQTR